MPEHEPFDGTVPVVVKGTEALEPYRWAGFPKDRPGKRFATWQEAMDFALSTDE